jgi:hypothetical protein
VGTALRHPAGDIESGARAFAEVEPIAAILARMAADAEAALTRARPGCVRRHPTEGLPRSLLHEMDDGTGGELGLLPLP